jgi:hypothetical protein
MVPTNGHREPDRTLKWLLLVGANCWLPNTPVSVGMLVDEFMHFQLEEDI